MKYVVSVCSDLFEDDGDSRADKYIELCEFFGTEDEAYKYINQCIGMLKLNAQNPFLVKVECMNSIGNIIVRNPRGIDDFKNREVTMDFDVSRSDTDDLECEW